MDELMNIALERFGKAGIEITTAKKEHIYYSILGELERNGYDDAYKYVTEAKLK